MCGIAGICSYKGYKCIDKTVLDRMRDTMVHRGPDGGSSYVSADGRVGLAHRRLSILDLSTTANQPMPNENENIWVVFNGEIYNHSALRTELKNCGHFFRTDHSDTEVIVHGYEQWGIDGLLKRIEGDYAIGLWDNAQNLLYLVRDRIGVKPLYFTLTEELLLFASEIKAIVAHPAVESDIDPMAMYHYLSFLTTPAPMTMFKGIYKLPAGHCLELKGDKLRVWQYWDAVPGQAIAKEEITGLDDFKREQFYIEGIRKHLKNAVEKRMMSDVPFGVFLSGGIDSSTNVALIAQYMDRPVDTFTVGFKDYTHLNELDYANLVAKKFRTNHHQILIDENDMRGYLSNLIHSQDEPLADWVCIPLYFVSKLAKDSGVTVIQVGEGSDEQFCGYSSYMGYLELYQKYWTPFRSYLPGTLQRIIALLAKSAAYLRPSLNVYADIIDRAARNREHFWSGATVFWDTLKNQLLATGSIRASKVPPAIEQSGLLPSSYLHPDSFKIIHSFTEKMDREHPGHDILTRMIYNEFKLRLPELLLMRVDKIAMSVSLEARVPFLDHHLVEYTMDIPMEDKVKGKTAKYLLKKAVEGLIPNEIIYRKKMGFGAPMAQWMRGEFGRTAESTVLSSKLLNRGYFNRDFIATLFRRHREGKQDNSLYLWTLFNLAAWYNYWIKK